MNRQAPLITLTTDFGWEDPYVGIMKGVILSICKEAQIVDLTHSIPPQDVQEGALALFRSFPYFPQGTVHLAVIDPEVGSARQAVALQTEEHFFIGPDSGVLDYVLARSRVLKGVALQRKEFFLPSISSTFHGRDIFAPAAAHLARGVPLDLLGEPLKYAPKRHFPKPQAFSWGHLGVVLGKDRFGNLFTNIPNALLESRNPENWTFSIGKLQIQGLSLTYADARKGDPVAILGSCGYLELALREGNFAQQFEIARGEKVRAEYAPAGKRRRS